MKEPSPKYNKGKKIDIINQKLGYPVRRGDPDAIDSVVPMACYDNMPIDTVTAFQENS